LGTELDRGGVSSAAGELAKVPDPLSNPRLPRPQGTNPYKAFRFSPPQGEGLGEGSWGAA
jgi:hypothetical protein